MINSKNELKRKLAENKDGIKFKTIERINSKLLFVILIITILFGVLRNIPYFSFLAPTVV